MTFGSESWLAALLYYILPRVTAVAAVRKCICVIRLQLGPFAVHGSVELR